MCEEVSINNNGSMTGYAVKDSSITTDNYEYIRTGQDGEKTINYNNHESVKASTTGNYDSVKSFMEN